MFAHRFFAAAPRLQRGLVPRRAPALPQFIVPVRLEKPQRDPTIPTISKALLQHRLQTAAIQPFHLWDVRTAAEVHRFGAIPTSQLVPLPLLLEMDILDADEWAEDFPNVELPGADEEIIVYCRSGRRSDTAARHLRRLGFRNVTNYVGSWLDWSQP